MPVLGSFNSVAKKDMMSEIWTNWDTITWFRRKHFGKGEIACYKQFLLFSLFSKAVVCCWFVKLSICGVKVNRLQIEDWSKWKVLSEDILTLSQTSSGFYLSALQVFWKHCVFYPYVELSTIPNKFWIVICKLFQFGRVWSLLFG